MRQQMMVINLVLALAAVGLAVKLRADWQHSGQRYRALEAGTKAAPQVPGVSPTNPASPADLMLIAQNNLFSPDRNSEVPKTSERKPSPPEPVLVGTMNLGRGRIALMIENGAQQGTMPRQVKQGDTFGGYKVTAIGDNNVELEYEGQKKKVDVKTAVRQVAAPATAASTNVISTAPATTVTSPSGGKSTNTGMPDPFGPGVGPTDKVIAGTTSVYGHKDNLPAGTVIGDRRKVERVTPFGTQVWWELVKPEEKKPQQ